MIILNNPRDGFTCGEYIWLAQVPPYKLARIRYAYNTQAESTRRVVQTILRRLS